MADTKGNIRARKLGNTGITEDILTKIANAKGGNAKGGHVLAIVELKADEVHEKVDGDDRRVDFLIEDIEPVVDGKLNGALVSLVRDIHAALYRNRMLAENGPQLPIDGAPQAPTNEEVLAAAPAVIEHDDQGPKLADLDEEPWEYDGPEGAGPGTKTPSAVEDPFAVTT